MTDDCLPIVVRPYEKSDTGLLFATYYETLNRERTLPFSLGEIRKAASRVFDSHFLSNKTVILAAVNPEDYDQIFGWIAVGHKRDRVHFLYVREPYRGQGIAPRLLVAAMIDTSAPIVATCWTKACETAPVIYRPRRLWRR